MSFVDQCLNQFDDVGNRGGDSWFKSGSINQGFLHRVGSVDVLFSERHQLHTLFCGSSMILSSTSVKLDEVHIPLRYRDRTRHQKQPLPLSNVGIVIHGHHTHGVLLPSSMG